MKTKIMKVQNQGMEQKEEKEGRGFSLVELIVVVAIMAILAVVIAPQIMKYIGQSRTSVDQSNMSLCESAVKTALANEAAYTEVVATSPTALSNIVVDVKAAGITSGTAVPTFLKEFSEILTNIPVPKSGSYFEITIPVDSGKIGKITVVPK